MELSGTTINRFGIFQPSSGMLMLIKNRTPELKFSGIRDRIRPIRPIFLTPQFWLSMQRCFALIEHSLMVTLTKRDARAVGSFVSAVSIMDGMVRLCCALLHLSEGSANNTVLFSDPFEKRNVFFILRLFQPHCGLVHQI